MMWTLANDEIPLVAIAAGVAVAIISIVVGGAKSILSRRAREQSRRELAAYVAEGTMTPDDAVRIMAAGERGKGCDKC